MKDNTQILERFHKNGKLLYRMEMLNGKRHGKVLGFRDNGLLYVDNNFKFDKSEGICKSWITENTCFEVMKKDLNHGIKIVFYTV